jgi:hypothetical protein
MKFNAQRTNGIPMIENVRREAFRTGAVAALDALAVAQFLEAQANT